MYQPGERWMYNTGSDVLGVLIERASGQPFETFLNERIFGPLGMTDTGFGVPWDHIGRLATSYVIDPEHRRPAVVYDEPAFPWRAAARSGSLAWLHRLTPRVADGAARGLATVDRRPGSVEFRPTADPQKAASGLVPGFFRVHGWGFGVAVVTERTEVAKSVGTYGWDGGMGTSWYNDPAEDLTMILMTQQAWASPIPPRLFQDFWTATYQAIAD